MTPQSVGAISGTFVMPPVSVPPQAAPAGSADDAAGIASGGPSQEDANQRSFSAAERANAPASGATEPLIPGRGDAVADDGAGLPMRRGLEAYGGVDGAAAVRAAETVARAVTIQTVAQVARQYGDQQRDRPEPTDGTDGTEGLDVVM